MFKTKEEIIVIQAETKDPIPTRAVFWSHDKGTAKMLFKLRKDGTCQSLAEGTIVPVVLDFNSETAENGRGRHIYHAVIEDAVNGIVSIVLEDNILGYQGRVDGSIYIELPDSRSLDTAGRFTFHIKRSPIDEDVPELEDYYWQGFGEIMEQYHESIAEIKSEAKELLDSLTADVTTAQNKVTALEQSITTANTNLNARIDEISKKIDDNDVFTKAESSANVINQIIGTDTVQITYSLDLMSKIAGSNIENVNSFKYIPVKNGIILSVATAAELSNSGNWDDYARVSKLDNSVFITTTTTKNESPGQIAFWNILGYLKKELSENFFLNAGAKTITQQSELVRKLVTGNTKISRWGYGVSPAGGGLTAQLFNTSTSTWDNSISHSISNVSRLTHVIDEADISKYINNEGILMQISFCNPSDGVTTSRTATDYANIEFTIELSANDYINYMIAQNHVTNLATTEEAKAGTNTTKTMTPATTAQAIDNRAVTLASNQTIGGIKNFKDGLMVADTSVVVDRYIEKTVVTTNTTDFTADSTVYFQRWGRMVVASVSITNKAANFAAWKTLMQFPDGYKPNRRLGWGGTLTNNTNRAPSLSLYANDSGISVMSPSSDFPASQNCVGTIPYFTSDAWPS
ncbi:phage baseplate upper protein [Enterococcus hailinensis]|uniref:phage baseplate upper protein n=1 Tax=Enterococcus hailinensis TaxID=3238988 RepID=UPI0038B2A65A